MNLEIEVNTEIETIEVLKISLISKRGIKKNDIYFALNDGQLIELVEKHEIDAQNSFIKSSVLEAVGISKIKNIILPVKVNMNEKIMKESFAKFVERNIKENTTTENNGVDQIESLKPVSTQDNFGIIG